MRVFWWNLRRRKNYASALFWILLFLTQPAHARIYIQIDRPSERGFPIAVVDLVPVNDRRSRDWSQTVSEAIASDLELTGLFEIIPQGDHPKDPAARSIQPTTIQFAPWSLVGARALANGGYSFVKGKVHLELHLYDPFLGLHLLSRTYVANEDETVIIAHHFADEILQELAGERGVFSTKIAFVSKEKKVKELFTMDMDGRNSRQITEEGHIALSPSWSSSGDLIAYTQLRKDGGAEVRVVPSSGGPSRAVTDNGTINVSPTWTRRGLLTVASAIHGDTEIYLMSLQGDILQGLTSSFGIDVNPSWSPDGSAFVFASERAGRLHLFRARADGSSVERLTYVGIQNDNPVWSPKGDKIVFQSMDDGWDLFIMNSDGSFLQRLTSEGQNESPSFAPNGRFIAFSSNRKGGDNRIYLMREDGSNQRPIGGSGSATQPAWSPWIR